MRAPLGLLLVAALLSASSAAGAKCSLAPVVALAGACERTPSRECLTQVQTMRLECRREADSEPISIDGSQEAPGSVNVDHGTLLLILNRLKISETKLTPIVAKLEFEAKGKAADNGETGDKGKTPTSAIPQDQTQRKQTAANAVAGGDFKTADAVAQQNLVDGHQVEAKAVLDQILAAKPDDSKALGMRAALSAGGGNYAQALSDARAALKADPNDQTASAIAALAESKLRPISAKPAPKLEFESKGFDVGAGSGRSFASSRGASAQDSTARAAEVARTQALLTGSTKNETVAAGWAKFRIGDYNGAVDDAGRALAKNPADTAALSLRAQAYNRLGKSDLAIADADAALKIEPRNVAALLERGYAKYEQHRYREALADVEQALAIDPLNAMGHLYRAMILEKMDRTKEAVASYLKAAELDTSLKPIVDDALTRLGVSTTSATGRAARRYWPIWIVAALAALALLAFGLKRVVKPEWATPVTPLR